MLGGARVAPFAPASYTNESKGILLNRIRLLGVAIAAVLVMATWSCQRFRRRHHRRRVHAGRAADGQLDQRLRNQRRHPGQIRLRRLRCGDRPDHRAHRRLRRLRRSADAGTGRCLQRLCADPLGAVGGRHRLQHPRRQEGRSEHVTGKVLAGIYFGKITKWNDPKIKKLNPGRQTAEPDHHPGLPHRRLRHHLRLHQTTCRRSARPGGTKSATRPRSASRPASAAKATPASPRWSPRRRVRSATSRPPT